MAPIEWSGCNVSLGPVSAPVRRCLAELAGVAPPAQASLCLIPMVTSPKQYFSTFRDRAPMNSSTSTPPISIGRSGSNQLLLAEVLGERRTQLSFGVKNSLKPFCAETRRKTASSSNF